MVLRGACRFGSVLAGGRVRRVLLLAGLVFAALPASAALGDTTVGQTATPHFYFGPGMEIAQTSAAMPAAGVVTEFQTQSGDCNLTKDGIYDFQVLRPLGNDQYRVVGDTGNQTDPCDSKLHTYPVRIPVQAGDVIGAYVVVNWQGFLGTDFPGIKSASAKIPKPVEGDTVTLKKDPADLGIDESATLLTGVGTTVGQTATPHFYFGPGMEIAQTSAPMPAAGVVTEFQTQSGDCNLTKDGIYDFQVLRPLGNDQYRVVGDTGNQTDPCDSKLHTYPVRIPVQAGDVIGAYVVVNWQGFLGTDFPGIKSASAKIPKPVEGDTVTLKKDPADLGIDESARLFKAGVGGPPPPTSKAQCKHGGWKNFPQFKNQGQCLRFVNSHHKKHHHKHHPSSLAARVWES